MKNIETQNMNLSPEVSASLKNYNTQINSALDAVQKLEALCVTKRLFQMFGVSEEQTAQALKQDYLITA